jgi:hypothetical protein
VGRLENIIARNRGWHRPSERSVVSLVFGLIVVVILALVVASGLGVAPPPPEAQRASERGKHIDGVLLRKAPAPARAPAQPAATR